MVSNCWVAWWRRWAGGAMEILKGWKPNSGHGLQLYAAGDVLQGYGSTGVALVGPCGTVALHGVPRHAVRQSARPVDVPPPARPAPAPPDVAVHQVLAPQPAEHQQPLPYVHQRPPVGARLPRGPVAVVGQQPLLSVRAVQEARERHLRRQKEAWVEGGR